MGRSKAVGKWEVDVRYLFQRGVCVCAGAGVCSFFIILLFSLLLYFYLTQNILMNII